MSSSGGTWLRRRGGGRALVLGAIVIGTICGCTGASAAPLPPVPSSVAVALEEYRFDHRPVVSSGRVIFEVANRGSVDHQLILVSLPEDLPGTLDDQLHSSERRVTPTIMTLPPLVPGQETRFAADLAPGRYGLICFLADPDGSVHALKGMNSEIRAQ